jgi:outer membrane protein assembly factor BamD (BamD/ComL family)
MRWAGYFGVLAVMAGAWLLSGCSTLRRQPDELGYDFSDEAGRERSGLLGVDPSGVVDSTKAVFGLGPDQRRAEELFALGQRQYQTASRLSGDERKKSFLEAAGMFAKAGRRWPDSALEEDALFHVAECHFFADRYPKAEDVFAQLVKKYPNTRYLDTIGARRFALARYWIELHQEAGAMTAAPNLTSRDQPVFDRLGHGIRVLEQIRLDDPTGELADDATMAAATACFADKRYYRADELFADLRRSYPNSEHQLEGHLLGLKCKMILYQGAGYDGQPLDEAEELVKQLRRQFPGEAREHEEFLTKSWKDVRMNRAMREIELARYFDRREEYRAARQHYAIVARDFSDTSLSREADERLAELGEQPDKPPQRLAWLAGMFPTPEREQPLTARNPVDALRR